MEKEKLAEYLVSTCGISQNLADFLLNKGVSLSFVEGNLVYFKEEVGASGCYGSYHREENIIVIPNNLEKNKGIEWLRDTLFHETGHSLFDDFDGDGIFNDPN